MATLEFREEDHIYTVDGEPIDSVTTILQEEGYINTRWYKEGAAEKGSRIHEATAAIDRGDLELSDFEGSGLEGYIEAWMLFKVDTDFRAETIEEAYWHRDLWYAGTIDRTGRWQSDEPIVLDIKSGQHELWHGLQLAAYKKLAFAENQEPARRVVHLKENGKYSLSNKDKHIGMYEDPAWDRIWQTIVTARIYKKRYGKK